MSDQPSFSEAAYIEEMRYHAKHILEQFQILPPLVGVVDDRPHSNAEYLLNFVKQFEDDAPTNVARCACVHPDRSMCIAIRTDRNYEEVMEAYDECGCGCHDEDEESEEMGE